MCTNFKLRMMQQTQRNRHWRIRIGLNEDMQKMVLDGFLGVDSHQSQIFDLCSHIFVVALQVVRSHTTITASRGQHSAGTEVILV
jgi:hypothetical protein